MGKRCRQDNMPYRARTNRGLTRIAVTLDSALREHFGLAPITSVADPFPVPETEAREFLEAVLRDEEEFKFGGLAGDVCVPSPLTPPTPSAPVTPTPTLFPTPPPSPTEFNSDSDEDGVAAWLRRQRRT